MKEETGQNIMSASATQGGHKYIKIIDMQNALPSTSYQKLIITLIQHIKTQDVKTHLHRTERIVYNI